jgi:hypothetical protein
MEEHRGGATLVLLECTIWERKNTIAAPVVLAASTTAAAAEAANMLSASSMSSLAPAARRAQAAHARSPAARRPCVRWSTTHSRNPARSAGAVAMRSAADPFKAASTPAAAQQGKASPSPADAAAEHGYTTHKWTWRGHSINYAVWRPAGLAGPEQAAALRCGHASQQQQGRPADASARLRRCQRRQTPRSARGPPALRRPPAAASPSCLSTALAPPWGTTARTSPCWPRPTR